MNKQIDLPAAVSIALNLASNPSSWFEPSVVNLTYIWLPVELKRVESAVPQKCPILRALPSDPSWISMKSPAQSISKDWNCKETFWCSGTVIVQVHSAFDGWFPGKLGDLNSPDSPVKIDSHGGGLALNLASNPFLVSDLSVVNLTYSLLPDEVKSAGRSVPQNVPIFLAFASAPS